MSSKTSGFDEFYDGIDTVTSQRAINKLMLKDHFKTLLAIIINTTKQGVGPGEKRYPRYSERYKKWKQPFVGAPYWLRGKGRTGKSGGMLDPGNFSSEVEQDGTGWIVWDAPDPRMAIYGEVHQEGLPLGRNGPRKQRKWLHFEHRNNTTALIKAYDATIVKIVAMFSAGWRRGRIAS